MKWRSHRFRAGGARPTWLALWFALSAVPAPAAELAVEIVDAAGRPTPAAVRLYDEQGTLRIPAQALDLGGLGHLYARGALIHYADWTSPRARSQYPFFGSSWFRTRHPKDAACFFVAAGFRIELPAGRYRLTVSKGLEYTPVAREIELGAAAHGERVALVRWVDMAARGWHSGDGHVHLERATPAADRTALHWAQAEDIRICHVLLMGDARQTYYAQSTFGEAGTVEGDGTWLIPGQEDPRTRHLGHTLHLGPPSLRREPGSYYDYRPVFAGDPGRGLSGFAHVGRRRWSLHADRGLTLLAPAGLVDFAEIAQMGYIGVPLWYEFLNLGFRLTAMAGSDVPWGGTIGATRVYAYSGAECNAGRWLEAVRRGHTFVTTGPMLEFSVNGNLPGSLVKVKSGERIRIKAKTWGELPGARPWRLTLVSLGEVVQTVTGAGNLETAMEVRAERSLWITAACETNRAPLMDQPGYFSGAIATPVYVEVDGRPWRDEARLDERVARRLQCLDEIERWLASGDRATEPGAVGGWESGAALERSAPAIRAQVRAARAYFSGLPATASK